MARPVRGRRKGGGGVSTGRDARARWLQRMVRRCGAFVKIFRREKVNHGLMSPATAFLVLGPHNEWPDEGQSQSSGQETDDQQPDAHE